MPAIWAEVAKQGQFDPAALLGVGIAELEAMARERKVVYDWMSKQYTRLLTMGELLEKRVKVLASAEEGVQS